MIKEKFKLVKDRLRWWNMKVFGWLDMSFENIVTEMNALGNVIAEGVAWLRYLTKGKCQIYSLIKQKSQVRWIGEWDRNTRFFHTCLQSRIRKNQILILHKIGI